MYKSLLWIGGVHGSGKSTGIQALSMQQPILRCLYLGDLFYHTAIAEGFEWEDLEEESKLLRVERKVKSNIETQLSEADILIDSHFCVYIGKKRFPGFHASNLLSLSQQTNARRALVLLFASPEEILRRRMGSKKKYQNYPTISNESLVNQELRDSEEYFAYFQKALSPRFVLRIDTTYTPVDKVVNLLERTYNELRS